MGGELGRLMQPKTVRPVTSVSSFRDFLSSLLSQKLKRRRRRKGCALLTLGLCLRDSDGNPGHECWKCTRGEMGPSAACHTVGVRHFSFVFLTDG